MLRLFASRVVAARAPTASVRHLHASPAVAHRLSEFFPSASIKEESTHQAGRSWHARDLRLKNSTDLHKLWYVLLKERNMLLTLQLEAKRSQNQMPRPDRLRKVRRSMAAVQVVIGERERAIEAAAAADPVAVQEQRENLGVTKEFYKHRRPQPPPSTDPNLYGLKVPGQAVPGQPQRPLKRLEKTKLRSALKNQRRKERREFEREERARLRALDDSELSGLVEGVRDKLFGKGLDFDQLDHRDVVVLKEARARQLPDTPPFPNDYYA